MKKVDIIIATFNRVERAKKLAESLLHLDSNNINKIYIVDSTENQKIETDANSENIIHILTERKNQPYQRYLGYLVSESEMLLFLDDDMEIVNRNCLNIILDALDSIDTSGIAIHFEDKYTETSLSVLPKSQIFTKILPVKKMINWVTGYPNMPEGKLGMCGVRGIQPIAGGATELISGGAFAAKRSCLYHNFNMQLFELYDQKLGKGEDVILGYTLSKSGRLKYVSDLLFYHVDEKDSSYSIDHFTFSKRVVFSRLYLSLEKSRLDNKSLRFARLHFHWHTFWRISGMVVNYALQPSNIQQALIKGAFAGWLKSFFFKLNPCFELRPVG